MQVDGLHVLQEDAALPVDDGLGQARRARRVENVQRVVEGQLGEVDGWGRAVVDGVAAQPGRPRDGVEGLGVGFVVMEVRHQDGVF